MSEVHINGIRLDICRQPNLNYFLHIYLSNLFIMTLKVAFFYTYKPNCVCLTSPLACLVIAIAETKIGVIVLLDVGDPEVIRNLL